MTKKDILTKIKRTILGEDGTPGITTTKKVQKKDKEFNDGYYKETDKKFKDYLNLEDDDFDTPKVNADEELEKTYGGSGMEGLTYDNEETEVGKKFTKRVDDLNKPSKDYYLKKDEVNDVYEKLKKKSSNYKKDKEIFQNTKPVRAIAAKTKNESTIKRLTYKTEFINESVALNLIPQEFKKDDLVFEMTDGNKLLKVRWEGGKNGRGVILLSKDNNKITKELQRMHQLFEYNSRETFGKTNLLTEEKELDKMVKTFKGKDETNGTAGTTTSTTPSTTGTPDPVTSVSSAVRPINLEVRQKNNMITAARYVEGKPNYPVTPGIIAAYDTSIGDWDITIDSNVKGEDIINSVNGILKKLPKSIMAKPALRREIDKIKNKLDQKTYQQLKFISGGD